MRRKAGNPVARGRLSCRWAVMIGVALLALSLGARADDGGGPPARVGALSDNYPYSFVDTSGQITGFGNEVFDAVARVMNLRFERIVASDGQMLEMLERGDIDVSTLVAQRPDRRHVEEFSVPFLILHGAIFVRKGDARFETIDALRTARARVETVAPGRDYLLRRGVAAEQVQLAPAEQALRDLAAGRCDAALFARLTGSAIAQRLGLKNIEPSAISLEGYVLRCGFTVPRGRTQLLAQLNEGLAIIQKSGEFDAIYQKWFGRLEPRRFSSAEVAAFVAVGLALALIFAVWGWARQRQLRQRLARQADALAESEALLGEAQHVAHVGHWHWEGEPPRFWWSEEASRIFGRDPHAGAPAPEELLGYFAPDDRMRWTRAVQQARETRTGSEFDAIVRRPSGEEKIVHFRVCPGRSARAGDIFGTVQDVTSWRAAERELQRSEEMLRALYNHLPFAIGLLEQDGDGWRAVSFNSTAAALGGLSATPATGGRLDRMGMSEARVRFFQELLERSRHSNQPLQVERHSEEDNRDYLITLVPIRSAGDPPRCCFFIEEVTARKRNDAEIAQGRRLRAIGELVGGIAHEFNNLLTPILLKADTLAQQSPHEPALAAELRVIAEAARRSAELTKRLLTFGRRGEAQLEVVSVRTLVESSVHLLRHTIDRRIVVESTAMPGLPDLWANAGGLHQVLLNLLLNARDTLMEKLERPPTAHWQPTITIEAKVSAPPPAVSAAVAAPQWILVTCRDNGLGMTPAVIERIFEPFYTTKEVGRGTGLGLATVWHIVTELGGRIDVESEPGDGTAFHLFLPVQPPPAGAEKIAAVVTPASAVAAPAEPSRTALRLLVVEDEEMISRAVSVMLRRLGYSVDLADDGAEAWARFAGAPSAYDALLIDLNMPGLTGLELARRVRQLAFVGPILVMSGRVLAEERQELSALQVSAIVEKPFTFEMLKQALEKACAPRGADR